MNLLIVSVCVCVFVCKKENNRLFKLLEKQTQDKILLLLLYRQKSVLIFNNAIDGVCVYVCLCITIYINGHIDNNRIRFSCFCLLNFGKSIYAT